MRRGKRESYRDRERREMEKMHVEYDYEGEKDVREEYEVYDRRHEDYEEKSHRHDRYEHDRFEHDRFERDRSKKRTCDKCHKHDCHCHTHHHHHHHEHCNDGALVEKVVCSKDVQPVAEFLLPAILGPAPLIDAIIALLGGVVNVRLQPDFNAITQEVTVIRDKVIIIGTIPTSLVIEPLDIAVPIPVQVVFQEHVECCGACPEDQVILSRPIVEATLNQPLLGADGTINLLLFKAILRYNITIVRQGIMRDGKICDLEFRRCDNNTGPVPIRTPFNIAPNTTAIPAPAPAQTQNSPTNTDNSQ